MSMDEVGPPDDGEVGLVLATAWWLDGSHVRLFDGWDAAVDHVARHLLSEPEGAAWRLVEPRLDGLAEGARHAWRERLFREASRTRGVVLQPLYDLYAEVIRRGIAEARHLGWSAPPDQPVTFLSLDGLVGVATRSAGEVTLTTAYLAGQATGHAVLRGREDGRKRPWRDCERPLRAQLRELREKKSAPELKKQERRVASWSREQRVYFDVFRPAVQVVRSMQYDHVRGRNDAALLKSRLPHLSQLRFEMWKSMRDGVRSKLTLEQS